MKYQTTIFDINKPTLKQVKVPLESDYGVAVKVKKDGQYIEDATVTLDGEQLRTPISSLQSKRWTLATLRYK